MNTIRISLLAAAVLALSACGGKQPGDTIIDMQADVCATGDPSVMQKYVSKKSQPAVGMISAVMAEPAKAEQMKAQIKEELIRELHLKKKRGFFARLFGGE
mgnify:CR=1 FL=1